MVKALALALVLLTACGLPAAELSTSLVVPSDLPKALHPLPAPMPWRLYPGMPTTAHVLHYKIIRDSDARDDAGDIVILRYRSLDELDTAYQVILDTMSVRGSIQPLADLGERGWIADSSSGRPQSGVVFVRCNTLIHIVLAAARDDAMAIARHVYERLGRDCTTATQATQ